MLNKLFQYYSSQVIINCAFLIPWCLNWKSGFPQAKPLSVWNAFWMRSVIGKYCSIRMLRLRNKEKTSNKKLHSKSGARLTSIFLITLFQCFLNSMKISLGIIVVGWLLGAHKGFLSFLFLNWIGSRKYAKKLVGQDKDGEVAFRLLSWATQTQLGKINLIFHHQFDVG